MRTSRVAQETSKAIGSMSAQRSSMRQAQARSLQNYAFGANAAATTASSDTAMVVKREKEEQSDSDLSSVPSDIEDTGFAPETSTIISTPPRKRKRVSKTATATTIKPSPSSPQSLPATKSPIPKKPRRAPTKKTTIQPDELKTSPPPNWERVYALCATQRARVLAPVDTMGCESLAEPIRSPQDQRLQTLIALMLSSQTKDTVTAAAIRTLQTQLPGGLTLSSLRQVDQQVLNKHIEKVGFHNNKARYIKQTAEILATEFAGDIPDSIDGLVSLPGVGPKMAYLCMSAAWGRDEGIGVDVHVHRITNLWGWHKTRTPEETRLSLQSWLPRDKWHGINHLLVGFGQTVCLPVGRRCGECDVGASGLCPSAVVGKKKVVKRGRAVKGEGDEEVKVETVEVEVGDVKEEDGDGGVLDIEDLGRTRSTRSGRGVKQ